MVHQQEDNAASWKWWGNGARGLAEGVYTASCRLSEGKGSERASEGAKSAPTALACRPDVRTIKRLPGPLQAAGEQTGTEAQERKRAAA